jgi:TRAP-type C4-dicarboxylate transport system permease small subunit
LLIAVDRRIVQVEIVVATGLVLTIVMTVLAQVVMRYVFTRPNPWTEELSRFAFIWLSLIGSSLATKHRAHFMFESSVNLLAPAIRRFVARVTLVLVSAMLLGIFSVGVQLAQQVRFERSPALDLPMVWVYSALPISTGLMLLHIVAGRVVRKEGQPAWASH